MAGKKGVERTKTTKSEDLVEISRRLRRAASAIQALAKAMEEPDQESVEVEGHKMLGRAFDSISRFVGNCQKKIRDF